MILITLIKTYICVDNNKIKYFNLEDMMVIIAYLYIFMIKKLKNSLKFSCLFAQDFPFRIFYFYYIIIHLPITR